MDVSGRLRCIYSDWHEMMRALSFSGVNALNCTVYSIIFIWGTARNGGAWPPKPPPHWRRACSYPFLLSCPSKSDLQSKNGMIWTDWLKFSAMFLAMWYLGHPWPLCKNFTEIVLGKPLSWGLNPRGIDKYSDFRPFEGYISETMQDMI